MNIRFHPLAALFVLAAGQALATESLPFNSLKLEAQVDRFGQGVAFGADSAWTAAGTSVARINAADNSVVDIPMEGVVGPYRRPAFGEGGFWVAALQTGTIVKISPDTNRVALRIATHVRDNTGGIAAGEGSVWAITGGDGTQLSRFSAYTGAEQATIKLPRAGDSVRVDFGSAWVSSPFGNAVYRIDPKTNAIVDTIETGKRPRYMATGEGSLWVLNQDDGTVTRIDGQNGKIVATIDAGLRCLGGDITAGGGYVWATLDKIRVAQIDPKTNALMRTFNSPAGPGPEATAAIAFGAGSVWLSGAGIQRVASPN